MCHFQWCGNVHITLECSRGSDSAKAKLGPLAFNHVGLFFLNTWCKQLLEDGQGSTHILGKPWTRENNKLQTDDYGNHCCFFRGLLLCRCLLFSHRASTTHAPIHIILVKSFARTHSVLRWAFSSMHAVLCLDAILLTLEVISCKQLLYWKPWLEVAQKRTAVEIAVLWYALIGREELQLLEWVCKNGCEEVDMVIHISYFSPCNESSAALHFFHLKIQPDAWAPLLLDLAAHLPF